MSKLSVGIVGLPNVGKSTLFNALLGKQQALAANYPFATVEPNVGVVPVPDARLERLASVISGQLTVDREIPVMPQGTLSSFGIHLVPAVVTFNDIAGLVKGAASGEGLGNKFLAHIREVDLICHVLRDFSDGDVVRAGAVSPIEDYETVVAELILRDLQSLEKIQKVKVKGQKHSEKIKSLLDKVYECLNNGRPARSLVYTDEEKRVVDELFLLTMKEEIGLVNVGEERLGRVKRGSKDVLQQGSSNEPDSAENMYTLEIEKEIGEKLSMPIVALSAKVEAEVAELGREDALVYLKELGIEESGLDRLVRVAYEKLGLISFLTAGEKEVRAWTVRQGANAPEAAGVIHTDFKKKFIKAKVIGYEEFVELGGWKSAAEKGRVRMEGRDYEVREGDVIEFLTSN